MEEYKKYLAKLHEINGLSPDEAKETVARVTDMMKELLTRRYTLTVRKCVINVSVSAVGMPLPLGYRGQFISTHSL